MDSCLRHWPRSKVVDIASGLARHALAECPDASGSLRRVGSTHHFRDYAVKVPQPGLVVPLMIAKIEERGAVQAAIRELQPDWLIDPDSIAAQGTARSDVCYSLQITTKRPHVRALLSFDEEHYRRRVWSPGMRGKRASAVAGRPAQNGS